MLAAEEHPDAPRGRLDVREGEERRGGHGGRAGARCAGESVLMILWIMYESRRGGL